MLLTYDQLLEWLDKKGFKEKELPASDTLELKTYCYTQYVRLIQFYVEEKRLVKNLGYVNDMVGYKFIVEA